MTTISPTNGSNLPILPQGHAERTLGQSDFLRLMTTQLAEQDPFNPVDNQAMVAQMAQFSSVAGISEMNVSLQSIADQIAEQTALLGDIRAATGTTAPPITP
jgi:flagellar basal-body rod modification protein FlgD